MINMRFYDYNEMIKTVKMLTAFAKNATNERERLPLVTIFGYSELGRPIIAIMDENPKIFIHGGMHAREHITSRLVSEMLSFYYTQKEKALLGICFAPLVNPDGAEICINGLIPYDKILAQREQMIHAVNEYASIRENIGEKYDLNMPHSQQFENILSKKYELIQRIDTDKKLELWKSNANGVDINNNFDADWGKNPQEVQTPLSKGYIGKKPHSEKETIAMVELTKKHSFEYTLSYHARGDIIYYGFKNIDPEPTFRKDVAMILDAPMKKADNSVGGYKDYFVEKYNKPGITIEIGSESGNNGKYSRAYFDLYAELPIIYPRHLRLLNYLIHIPTITKTVDK